MFPCESREFAVEGVRRGNRRQLHNRAPTLVRGESRGGERCSGSMCSYCTLYQENRRHLPGPASGPRHGWTMLTRALAASGCPTNTKGRSARGAARGEGRTAARGAEWPQNIMLPVPPGKQLVSIGGNGGGSYGRGGGLACAPRARRRTQPT